MNALLFQYEICNVSRGLSETANCAHELFRGHSHCVKLTRTERQMCTHCFHAKCSTCCCLKVMVKEQNRLDSKNLKEALFDY